jgi:hypothetical protein
LSLQRFFRSGKDRQGKMLGRELRVENVMDREMCEARSRKTERLCVEMKKGRGRDVWWRCRRFKVVGLPAEQVLELPIGVGVKSPLSRARRQG